MSEIHPTFEELEENIIQWARERGILEKSDPKSQLLKTVSELGELADGVLHDDKEEIVDGIGDAIVTIILLAELSGYSTVGCLASAYGIIKDRKGSMINGVFKKDE